MKTKFIKYRAEQINLVKLYQVSTGNTFDCNDVHDGTLVIGYWGEGKYLAMGYLRGMTRDMDTGEVIYNIANAIEGEYANDVQAPHRVNVCELPCFAATSPEFNHPVVGRVYKCDGKLAVMDMGCGKVTVNVNSVLDLVPYFKDVNQ